MCRFVHVVGIFWRSLVIASFVCFGAHINLATYIFYLLMISMVGARVNIFHVHLNACFASIIRDHMMFVLLAHMCIFMLIGSVLVCMTYTFNICPHVHFIDVLITLFLFFVVHGRPPWLR